MALMAGSLAVMWGVFIFHLCCLRVMSFDADVMQFSLAHPRVAQLLEIGMYVTGGATMVFASNGHEYYAALFAVGYGAVWYMLLRYAPPYPDAFGSCADFPDHWREKDR
jgi:hypothetical protein